MLVENKVKDLHFYLSAHNVFHIYKEKNKCVPLILKYKFAVN